MFRDKHSKSISIHAFPKCKSAALPLVRPVWCVVVVVVVVAAVDDDDDDDDISAVVTIYIYIQGCLIRISAR